MKTLNLTTSQSNKIDKLNVQSFELNYNVTMQLKKGIKCFIVTFDEIPNELIFSSIDEFNGWLKGAVNAIYQLESFRTNYNG